MSEPSLALAPPNPVLLAVMAVDDARIPKSSWKTRVADEAVIAVTAKAAVETNRWREFKFLRMSEGEIPRGLCSMRSARVGSAAFLGIERHGESPTFGNIATSYKVGRRCPVTPAFADPNAPDLRSRASTDSDMVQIPQFGQWLLSTYKEGCDDGFGRRRARLDLVRV